MDQFRDLEGGETIESIINTDDIRIVNDFSGYKRFMEKMRKGQGICEGIQNSPKKF